jgi:xylose isomerase
VLSRRRRAQQGLRHDQSRQGLRQSPRRRQSNLLPAGDGYDYPFHTDYRKAWSRMVDTVRQAAEHLPEIPLFMEYKPSETRVHCTLDSAAKALLLCEAVGNPNVGVTIDIGHSIYGGETPAEALAR